VRAGTIVRVRIHLIPFALFTGGSRGTWPAAVAAVATAVAAVDMIMKGECVNSFCVTRPPGHHAGRSLHAMKAVSNGFCVLNTVACAAIYATTPVVEGGLGLSRVCVIDFDVHHGNGTQDILCSTYDPRFLYVSIHAGGAEVNGMPMEDDPEHELHDLGSNPKQSGIYPGRCGDISPHMGVLNIPLGPKVTSHAVGSAVITHINPAVDAFAPDLIILSAGFDAHKNDPMCLGALTAQDFGHITEVACELAFKSCSGRVLSVLEGGYGVPCCRPQKDVFLPSSIPGTDTQGTSTVSQESKPAVESTIIPASQGTNVSSSPLPPTQRPQPSKLLDIGDDLPSDMDDQVPYALQRRLDKCHSEGFVDCVREHVKSLARCNKRK
jgi:acetoin utilization deacetylase AcuC-like enzyme